MLGGKIQAVNYPANSNELCTIFSKFFKPFHNFERHCTNIVVQWRCSQLFSYVVKLHYITLPQQPR